jgi:hypothetical protein
MVLGVNDESTVTTKGEKARESKGVDPNCPENV